MRGHIVLGTFGALAAAIAASIAWAAITATTGFQIGYMALAVGFLAGYGMRVLGGTSSRAHGVIAAVVALGGCVLGNVLAAAASVAQHDHDDVVALSLFVLAHPPLAGRVLADGFNVMDLLFYGLAVLTGYRTALTIAPKAFAQRSAATPEPREG